MATYTFVPLSGPVGSISTEANAINDAGQVVGDFVDGNSQFHGFLYSNGKYTILNVPGATLTEATGINNAGQIVGDYSDGNGLHGFLYSGGVYTTLDDTDPDLNPQAGTNVTGINDAGQIVGWFTDVNSLTHGFLYSNGIYTTLNDPSATFGTQAAGINDAGQVVGQYQIGSGAQGGSHGFVYDSGSGTYTTTLNDPSNPGPPYDTSPKGINNAGQIIGSYFDSNSRSHGFLYDGGNNYATIDDPAAGASANVTTLAGINDAGQIVGYYQDASGDEHSFVGLEQTPVFTTLDDPSAHNVPGNGTGAAGINNTGQIVGSHVDASGVSHGYLYSGGVYTTVTDNLIIAENTVATGINDSGRIVGYSAEALGFYIGFVDIGGSFSIIDDPNSSSGQTFALGINDANQIVGYYNDSSGSHGFLKNGEAYTTLDDPQANGVTVATGINASGEIVGYYYNGSGAHGFLYSGGVYTTLDDPLANDGNGTFASGINDAGEIVGRYFVGGHANGFLYSGGVYTPLNDPSALNLSVASGINNSDQIVGLFDDSTTNQHGFATNLVMQDFFTAVESKTGDKITGVVFDDTGKYSVGSTYQSPTDTAGGTWTYTVTNVQVAASPFQNPAYSGYVYDITYHDADLNITVDTNFGEKGYAGINPQQNYSGTNYFGSDSDAVTIDGNTGPVGHYYVVPDPVVAHWAHRVSGNWTTVSNWNPSVVPGYNDNVVINLAGPYTITSLSDETVNSLALVAGVSLDIEGGSGFVTLKGTGTGANSGTIDIQDNSTFEIGGTFKNAGVIILNSTGDTTEWVIDGNVTLGGEGKVHLAKLGSAIVSDGSIGTLTNVNNTVSGNGTIGDANLTVINQSLGVIEAGAKQSLAITGGVTNLGNVESYGSLQFDSDDVNNAAGKIRTLAAGASISLDGATIAGGTVSTVAGSTITGSGSSEIDGATVTNAGNLAAGYGSTFTINSSVINNGILQAANGNLILNGAVTGTGSAAIIGTGELKVVSALAENISFAANSTGTLILDTPAALSGTIHGFDDGTIDLPNISFGIGTTFSYTPNASNTGGTLHVSDGTHSANIGLFGHFQPVGFQEGDDGAGGTLIGYAVPIFWNSGISGNFTTASNWNPSDIPGSGNAAIITAAGTYTVTSSLNETVYSLTTATGTTLEITADKFTATNQSGAVTNAGTIAVDSAATLAIDQGLIKNTGTVAVSGTLNFGSYPSLGNVTLQGGGNVTLSGTNASINSNGTNATLTNTDNTISGVGYLSLGGMLINQSSGIIDANGSGSPGGNNILSLSVATLNNAGTIESTGYGNLFIYVNQAGNLNNSGTIEATSDVGTYSTITGPVVNTGNIEVLGAANLTINGAVAGTGNETINDGALTLVAGVSAGQQLTFSGSSGALTLEDASDFAGTVAGFALGNSIDLTTIKFSSSSFNLTYTPNQNNTGGVLSVTDGTNSAAINILGSYTQANFIANTDGSVGTLITDPPVIEQPPGGAAATIANDTVLEVNATDSGNVTFVGATGTLWLDQPATFSGTVADFGAQDRIDLSNMRFGAHTTLGYSENKSDTGGTLTVTDGTHAAAIALFGNYMASTLVIGADGHGGTSVTEAPQPGQPPPLAHPHA
jgi:probable HAF family extracellular repeat protein